VLSRKGYAGTRLSDVADQAEIQAPAIYYYYYYYYYFPSRDDLIEEVMWSGIADYTTASIRNAGQVPESVAIRYAAEASQYGEMWRKLLQDADNAGRPGWPGFPDRRRASHGARRRPV